MLPQRASGAHDARQRGLHVVLRGIEAPQRAARGRALYLGAVRALAQGIAQLGPSVGAPEWFTRWFLVAAGIGFPFAMLSSWFYEWRPQGLAREGDVAPGDSISHDTGRKLDFAIIGVLSFAVVLLLTKQFVARQDTDAVAAATGQSIAVLPLANASRDAVVRGQASWVMPVVGFETQGRKYRLERR